MSSLIPRTQFTTDLVHESERYDIFKESIAVLFDLEAKDKKNLQLFEAHLDAYMFDQLMLARTQSNAAQYTRNRKSIQLDSIDSIMIQLILKGDIHFQTLKDHTHVESGEIVVFDLGQALDNFNTDFDHLSVLFPRELIEAYIPNISHWHGKTLPSERPMTRLLKNHIISLYEVGTSITNESCSSIQKSMLELTSSALQHSADILPEQIDTLDSTLLLEVKKWIRTHLADPELSPNSLCQQFGLSRAHLYRVTEPLGGITNYIRDQRLKRSYADLQNPDKAHLSIAEIAYDWGFGDAGTYTRNFKKLFGFLPKDARELRHSILSASNQVEQSSEVDRNYENWVRSLSI